MNNDLSRQQARDAARAEMAALLADYPALSDADLARVLHWFRKDASSMDVAMLACEEDIAAPYRQFRRDHIDRFGWRDLRNAVLFLALFAGLPIALFLLG